MRGGEAGGQSWFVCTKSKSLFTRGFGALSCMVLLFVVRSFSASLFFLHSICWQKDCAYPWNVDRRSVCRMALKDVVLFITLLVDFCGVLLEAVWMTKFSLSAKKRSKTHK